MSSELMQNTERIIDTVAHVPVSRQLDLLYVHLLHGNRIHMLWIQPTNFLNILGYYILCYFELRPPLVCGY